MIIGVFCTALLVLNIWLIISRVELAENIDKLWASRDSAYFRIEKEIQERVKLNKKLRGRVAKLEFKVNALIKKSGDSTPRHKL